MAETVAAEMPSAAEIAACEWLTEDELARLQRRVRPHRIPGRPATGIAAAPPARRTPICRCSPAAPSTQPSCFIAGASDWGVYQKPGDFEQMQTQRLHADARLPSGRRAPATGCSRSSRRKLARWCWNSCERRPPISGRQLTPPRHAPPASPAACAASDAARPAAAAAAAPASSRRCPASGPRARRSRAGADRRTAAPA